MNYVKQTMNGTIKVRGGRPLKGTVTPIPNKNSILAVLPAALLTDQTVTYKNVPRSSDVLKVLEMLKNLGAEVDDSDFDNLKITCAKIKTPRVDEEIGGKIRSTILFTGPLLARLGCAEIPLPGGCTLGQRSIAAHIDAFQKCGITFRYENNYAIFETMPNPSADYFIWQTEASVTATENIAMYAAGINSHVQIIDAACEPHVVDLLNLLKSMGANIDGIGSNRLHIDGRKLHGAEFHVRSDPIDIAGYIVAAAITDGEIRIKDAADLDVVGGIVQWFRKFNISIEISGNDLIVKRNGELKIDINESGFPLAGDDLPKFYPRPWPGFPVDALPPVVTLACKTNGKLLVSNWMYENGLTFVNQLNTLGAKITVVNPQSVVVEGLVQFKGGEVDSPDIIQSCKAIFLAALCDPVETTLHGVDILKRRYPDIFTVYKNLGADIEVL